MTCSGPGCTNEVPVSSGPGRPSLYCGESCRKRAQRDAQHAAKAFDALDLLRGLPTGPGIAALSVVSSADLDRILVIGRRWTEKALRSKSGTPGVSGNPKAVIVTPRGDG